MVSEAGRRQIVRESFYLTGARYLEEFVNTIRGFIIATLLGPEKYGAWHVIKIIYSSGQQVDFGTTLALVKEASALGLGDELRRQYQDAATVLGLLGAVAAAAIMLLVYRFVWQGGEGSLAFLTALAFLFAFLFFHLRVIQQSQHQLIQMAKVQLLFALLNFLVSLTLLWFWGIHGLLAGVVISLAVVIARLLLSGQVRLGLGVERRALRRLLAVGIPLFLVSVSSLLMYRIDSLVVYALLGSPSAGYYGLSVFLVIVISQIPGSASTVMFPKMARDIGRHQNNKSASLYTEKPTLVISTLMIPLLGLTFINIDWVVVKFLAEYVPALPCLKTLMVFIYFLAAQKLATNAVIAMNRQLRIVGIHIGLIFLGAVADVAVIYAGYGIVAVALATGLLFYAMAMFTVVCAFYAWGGARQELSAFMLKIHGRFLYFVAALWLVFQWPGGADEIVPAVTQSAAFLLLLVPFLLIVGKQDLDLKSILRG